jgi:hypothetical protein
MVDEDALSVLSESHRHFVEDMAKIISSRGHGNEPLPLPKAEIVKLRKAAFSTIKTLIEQ